jgi:hypothetical protein
MNTPEKEKMTTTEHLQKIKAKCERLLAIAEKRTQGDWEYLPPRSVGGSAIVPMKGPAIVGSMWSTHKSKDQSESDNDAFFIAACAGSAEAGWRSTIAAIDCIEDMAEHIGNHQASLIIAAWPTELLQ